MFAHILKRKLYAALHVIHYFPIKLSFAIIDEGSFLLIVSNNFMLYLYLLRERERETPIHSNMFVKVSELLLYVFLYFLIVNLKNKIKYEESVIKIS